MCGIAGYVGQGNEDILRKMTSVIAHRGPDDEGFFIAGNVGLGFRRLSIIDLTGGRQPMFNETKTVAVVFNGEIYNFRDLKNELTRAGHRFSTQSDTEVIVHGYEQWGSEVFARCNGMFAVAVWDGGSNQLILARDRLGKKPLYWGVWQGTLVFGSEPKALLQHPLVKREMDWQSLAQYLTHEYVPTPHSIYAGMRKLPEGCTCTYAPGREPEVTRFWDVKLQVTPVTLREALPRLDTLLSDAVRIRMVSDVPLGVFLSGGIDSSTVAYYAQAASSKPIKTFSIGFAEASFDESSHARRVAKHLGTEHYDQVLRPAQALELVPKISDLCDEPLADASLIPTYLLSKFAKNQVTVALGGDGGDELFLGYQTFQAEYLAQLLRFLPHGVRRHFVSRVPRLRPHSYDYFTFRDKMQRFLQGLGYPDDQRHLVWRGSFPPDRIGALLTDDARERCRGDWISDPTSRLPEPGRIPRWSRLSYWYLKSYLMDDVLVKVDRASMYASLEVRAPILDYRLVEFAFSLPWPLKLHRYHTKFLLKRLMRDRLPVGIVSRRKQGFAVPIGAWLRGELKPLAQDLLSADALRHQGIFQPAVVQRLLSDHLDGRADNRKELWTLMCFQLWWQRWGKE
ncbi:MAG: asparagine synthase (glutamine-hydrolyzing) [Patescibacteria group bacterium]|nr:asparagine synthase (glutamine-hydrolyzing) [Patescibacteria group bacterium]